MSNAVRRIAVRCSYCGARWTIPGLSPAAIRRWVAREVGHPMDTLDAAIEHIICPRCEQTRLERVVNPPRTAVQPKLARSKPF